MDTLKTEHVFVPENGHEERDDEVTKLVNATMQSFDGYDENVIAVAAVNIVISFLLSVHPKSDAAGILLEGLTKTLEAVKIADRYAEKFLTEGPDDGATIQ